MSQAEFRDALFIPEDSRANFKNVIAKRSDLVQFDGGRLAPSLYGTTQYAGLVLGKASSGGDAGFYKAYNNGNSDGSEVAVGVLAETQTIESAGDGSEIVIIKEGILFEDLLIGLDSAGKTDMGAKSSVEHGVNLIRIRA